jgi:hypothetical protein
MATLTLPVRPGVPHQRFFVELEAVTYGIDLLWNGRAGAWSLSILDRNGAALLSGRRVVIGFPLTVRAAYDLRLPPGQIVAIDTTGADKEPGLEDLGARVPLLYVEAADVPA